MNDEKRTKYDSPMISEEANSSSSENLIIPSKENTFTVCKIKIRKALSDTLKHLKNPFVILDNELISYFNIDKSILKEGETFEKSIDFSAIPKQKVLFLDNENKISEYYNNMKKNKKNNIIFSSFNYKINKKEDPENDLFIKLFKFNNNIENECNISDFCSEHKIIFENKLTEKFYPIIRKPRSHLFRFHLYDERRILMKLFGPRKSCKSIYLRCVLSNYHCKYKIFRPTLIFDIDFINKNLTSNNSNFQKIFYHELFSLFNDIYYVDEFFRKINFKIEETMKFVDNVINLYLNYVEDNKLDYTRPLFCLDNYSYIYDENNHLKNIENISRENKKFNLYIIYSMIDQEDNKEFIKYIDTEFNPGFNATPYPICYESAFRFLNEIKNYLFIDNIEIPPNYENIFGQNVYFLFKYLNIKDANFDVFVQNVEIEIVNEIKKFYGKSINKKYFMEKLIDIIENKKKIDFDEDLFTNIPLGYIIINKNKNKYNLEYCFPLIKNIINTLSKTTFFIDINNPDFYKLADATMSDNYDEFINFIFKTEKSFFGYTYDEIEKTVDEECLEIKSVDKNGEQLYQFGDVLKVLEGNKAKNFWNLINKYKNTNLLKGKNLIFVFQKFGGKFVDVLVIVKNRSISDYSIVNFQIKLSNSYKVARKEKEKEPYRMTYLKHKYEFIFGIKIIDSYIIYISLYELKKKFAENNEDICIFYSRDLSTFVDSKRNVLKEFPFLPKARVELISEFNIFLNFYKQRLENKLKMKLHLKKIDNIMIIYIMKDITDVKIKFMNHIKSFVEINDDK